MPSGYTEGIQTGKITSFKEYALLCARNFGALITMRDDPLDSPIPDEFKPNPYYLNRLNELKSRLHSMQNNSDEILMKMYDEDVREERKYHTEQINKKQIYRTRYEAMLKEAETYIPPTAEHKGLAEFMISQLKESIDFDTDTRYSEKILHDLNFMTFENWKTSTIEELVIKIHYAEKAYYYEVERVNNRNQWVKQLRKSLDKYE